MKLPRSGGGWHAVGYTLSKIREAGGFGRLWRAMRSRNACKTCALGMGGQRGGMVNEAGHFPEVCKKSLQAQVADMQPGIRSDFWQRHSIAELATWSPKQLEHAGRLREPVIAEPGATHYRPIEWDDALDRIVSQLGTTDPNQSFWYCSGRSSNEAGFLTQLLARRLGTNHVNNCSYYCHQASGVGLASVVGSGTATVQLDDLDHCDLVVVWGANPASNHPRFMRTLMELRRRGGRCVVINPLRERGLERFSVPSDARSLLFGSEIADLYLQPHIGGDRALIAGVIKHLIASDAIDHAFLTAHCSGHEALLAEAEATDWATVEQISGVSQADIRLLADAYAASSGTVLAWAMGITHHTDGVDNVRALAGLACLRGMIGRPGAGLLPLRGHSNVQGIGSMGVTPALKQTFFAQLETALDIALPTAAGYDTMACMEAAAAGDMRFAWCLGGNLYGSNPDAAFASAALAAIDLVVSCNTTLNTGHACGRGQTSIILPVLARDEEPETTTQESMFSLVRVSDGGRRRHIGPLSEIQVIAEIAARLWPHDSSIDWSSLRASPAIRELIAKVVPGYAAIDGVDKHRSEFFVAGRHLNQPGFPTDDGKAHLHPLNLTAASTSDTLRLMTIRSEGQFNTVVYEEHDRYRGQDRRDVILLSHQDCARLGVQPDQRVDVHSATGTWAGVLVRVFDITPGNAAMYYPEANVLVPRGVDADSRTPAFKNVAITLTPSTSANAKPTTKADRASHSEPSLAAT